MPNHLAAIAKILSSIRRTGAIRITHVVVLLFSLAKSRLHTATRWHNRRLAMFPATSPIASLSRSRLKALSIWVRDELDQLVAREGPNVLRPDDVLILHETFIALYHAAEITALDLRATGIHRAVQDISGVATRWPSRLCDDCDKIITSWTAKFGSLNDLHPFLYGRGGRLEGIASATEYTREVGCGDFHICPLH